MSKCALKLVPKAAKPEPGHDAYAYESAARQYSSAKDWARIHINGDRAPPLALPVNWRPPR